MSTGPCLCGDPFCPSCGGPEAAELEVAEQQAMEALSTAHIRAEEYEIVIKAGLVALELYRQGFKAGAINEREQIMLEGPDNV